MELKEKAGTKNKPEDKGVSKGKGKYTGSETGKGKRKTGVVCTRDAAPESSDDDEDSEYLDLFGRNSVLLRKGKVKGKGKGKDKDADSLQGPPRSQPRRKTLLPMSPPEALPSLAARAAAASAVRRWYL